jgi:hypothetical protein
MRFGAEAIAGGGNLMAVRGAGSVGQCCGGEKQSEREEQVDAVSGCARVDSG